MSIQDESIEDVFQYAVQYTTVLPTEGHAAVCEATTLPTISTATTAKSGEDI